MIQFIKNNKFVICLVMGFVALALAITHLSDTYNTYDNYSSVVDEFDNYCFQLLIDMVKDVMLIIASIVFIIMGYKNNLDKSLITLALIAYCALDLLDLVVTFRNDNYSTSPFVYAALDIMILVFCILSITNRRYFLTMLIVLMIDMSFNLLSTFNGSTRGLSALLIEVLILGSIYFYSNNSYNNDNNYYN